MFAQDTFTSASSGDWSSNGSWTNVTNNGDGDGVPDSDDTVVIGSGHDIIVDATTTVSALTVNSSSGTSLTLNADLSVTGNLTLNDFTRLASGNLTVGGDLTIGDFLRIDGGQYLYMSNSTKTLTNNGRITVNSGSDNLGRIVVMGTIVDNGGDENVYQRYINGTGDAGTSTGWDLIGVPTSDTSINDFVDTNDDVAENGSGNSILYGVGFYDPQDNDWETYGGSATENNISSSGNFVVGKGYQMATTSGSAVEFNGSLNSGDLTTAIRNWDLDDDTDMSDGSRFNLVANPYLSFIYANDNTDTTNNLITANAGVLHANGQALYFWDGDEYIAVSHSTTSSYQYVAPFQGFMVMAKTTGSNTNFSFTRQMQTLSGTNDAIGDIMNDDTGELFIGISQLGIDRKTEIYFSDDGTDGLDPGFDAAAFSILDVYASTRLISNDEGTEGVNFAIQTLAYSEMWDKVIPLGINAYGGEEMTISISHRTTPADLNIYLEDTEEVTMTNLLDGDFVYTPSTDLSGVGRFFIHMTADTMSNEDVSTSLLNAYKEVDASYITIEGLATQTNETKVSLYNILGREVLSTTLNNNMGTQTISTVGLSAGIYVIELESGTDRLTKKLLIQYS
jgi:hypothetical protein